MPRTAPAPVRFAGLRRRVLLAVGWFIVALGVIITPVPGPGGFPVVLLGGMIVLRNSDAAKRGFVRWKRRYPRLFHPVERLRIHLRRRRLAAVTA